MPVYLSNPRETLLCDVYRVELDIRDFTIPFFVWTSKGHTASIISGIYISFHAKVAPDKFAELYYRAACLIDSDPIRTSLSNVRL
jgi:hypothetical protein